MRDLKPTDYERAVSNLTRAAADDFRQSAATEQEQRAALCRYFRHGTAAEFSHPELIDFLAVSTPSVLEMAGYSVGASKRVMEFLVDISDQEIDGGTL